MIPRLKCVAALVPLLFVNSLYAEEDPGTVVVTATRQAARANELLSDVSVIGREEIEKASPVQTLGELLAKQGGVEFSTQGPPGSTGSVFIRGTNSAHTILLIDGVRVGSATTGGPNIAAIPLSQIERVEILRGSASSLYGADAIGGVIQVFTRRGEGPPKVDAEISTGTHQTHEGNVGISGKADAVRYSLRVGGSRSHGFNIISNPANTNYNKDQDGYRNINASSNISVDIAPGHEVGLQALYSRFRNQYDSAYYDAFWNPSADYDFRATTITQSYSVYSKNKLTSSWSSLLRVGRSTDNSKNDNAPGIRDTFKTDQDQFVWQNDFKLPVGSLLLATEYLRQSVDSTKVYAEDSRSIKSLLGGWTGNLGDHRIQLNLRHDRNSQFGNKTRGGAAYGYQIDDYWRVRTAYSTGFKAPSFNDLYYPGSGNPDLKPESSRSREIGLNYDAARTSASLTIYRNDIDDMIEWAPVSGGGGLWLPSNVGEARITGGTLSGQHDFGSIKVHANLDIQNPKDRNTEKYLRHRAKRHASVGFDHAVGKFSWGADVQASGKRYNDTANKEELSGYVTVGLRVAYQLDHDLTLFAKAGNIFNKEYEFVQ